MVSGMAYCSEAVDSSGNVLNMNRNDNGNFNIDNDNPDNQNSDNGPRQKYLALKPP